MTLPVSDLVAPIMVSTRVCLMGLLWAWPWAVMGGWLFATKEFKGKSFLLTLMLAPAVMPPLVMGYLLLLLLSPRTEFGGFLVGIGLEIPLTEKGAILAASVVGWPYLLSSARQGFLSLDPRLLQVAATLGASPLRSWVKVALPIVMPSILAGGLLALSRSLGEFGATLLLAGSIPGETQTMTLAVYQWMESTQKEGHAFILVGIMLFFLAFFLMVAEYLTRRQRKWRN